MFNLTCFCMEKNEQPNDIVNSTNNINVFTGNYSGSLNGINYSASLKSNGNNITGTIIINGKGGKIIGTSNGSNCKGTVLDDENASIYMFTAQIDATILNFKIDLSAIGGQIISLDLTRDSVQKTIQKTVNNVNKGKLNANLFGLWRYTSVHSSGSGDYHFSMSTDYFLDLRSDGTFTRWTGKSGGGTLGTLIITEEDSDEDKTIGTWYCESNILNTQQDSGQLRFFKYYSEGNQMMLTTRYGDKSVYERVR